MLTAALTIHSVEARHASEVRRLRGNFSETVAERGVDHAQPDRRPRAAAVYAGEENPTQLGIDLTTSPPSARRDHRAFDEPLSMQEVLAIVDPFIA